MIAVAAFLIVVGVTLIVGTLMVLIGVERERRRERRRERPAVLEGGGSHLSADRRR